MRRVFSATAAMVMAIVLSAPLAAEDASCKRPELAWEFWFGHVQVNNPGIERVEVEEPAKSLLFMRYPCDDTAQDCPPDRAIALYSEGNADILIAFVTAGCVTLAEEMPVPEFLALVGGEAICRVRFES
jgi:hypothetical protein